VLLNNLHQTTMNLALCASLVDELLGFPYRDWNRYFLDKEKRRQEEGQARLREKFEKRHHGTRPSRELAAYLGKYHHDAYGAVEVTQERGGLVWKYNGLRAPLEHLHYDTFVLGLAEIDHPLVTFELNRDGEVATLRIPEPVGAAFAKRK
jgi:hypothetical protein